MKSKINFYTVLIITTILGYMIISTSCLKNEQEEQDTYFLVEVDSIAFADTISTTDTLSISFYGTIGNNGCYSFSNFYPVTNEDTLDIEVWGKLAPGEDCASVMVYLEGEQLNVINFDEGTFFVHVRQPGGGLLIDSLIVIPAGNK